MTEHVYWHAPVWEIVVIAGASIFLIAWLLVVALRRPNSAAALSAVHPVLNEQPILFFDRVNGITTMNDASKHMLDQIQALPGSLLIDALLEVFLETHEEARIVQQRDWPEADQTLVAIPIYRHSEDVAGVLASVVPIEMLSTPDRPFEKPHEPVRDWIVLGPTLRLQRGGPTAHVRHIDPATEQPAAIWQETKLTPSEDALLRFLIEQPGEVHTAESLFALVWPDDEVNAIGLRPDQKDRLRRLVFQLRQRIEPDPRSPRYLRTAHGIGYACYIDRAEKGA
ncbi:MAG: winged helix-turn-helix domain-containing protein [Chloroflexi bacterium]|nr:winged helix-turn-helix domain-containing protein [Chloroflexota bacterium]